jgi:hypothetical protein
LRIILFQYAGWVTTNQFHRVDDYFGYLVFPEKMIQMGSMGPDPFSGRRMGASLGGQSFLHTFVLSLFSEQNLRIIDPGITSIVVVGLILGFLQENKISPRKSLLILLPAIATIPPARNSTAMIVSTVLLLSLFRTLNWEKLKDRSWIANACIIALITSALAGSKYSLLPTTGLFFGLTYGFYLIHFKFKRTTIYEFIAAIFLIFLLLLPWMISMYQSSGTLLYPFLGKGYTGYYQYDISPSSEIFTFRGIKLIIRSLLEVTHIVLFLLIIAYLQLRPWKAWQSHERKASLAFLISVCFGVFSIIVGTGGRSARYTFPFVYAAIIILIILIITQIEVRERIQKQSYQSIAQFLGIFVIGILIVSGGNWANPIKYYTNHINNIKLGLANVPLVAKPQESDRYLKLQQSIPPGEIILTRLNKPFLLDFKRNQIFIVDVPGAASPPPGMPLFQGSEVLSNYLTSQSIRYVAYAYKNGTGFSRRYWIDKLGSEIYPWVKPNKILELHPWVRNEVQYTLDFQDNLKKLGENRKIIYDDGQIFVIDLLTIPS